MEAIVILINSVPEPLATAILTATFTGLVISFLQKRVENSFAKQLEEFKASLQLSNFEQQTKFVKLHEKRVVVLETLYRMFLPIPTEYNNYTIEELYSCSENIPLLESMEKRGASPAKVENLRVKLDEFWNYFVSNRLFFSDKTIHEIEGCSGPQKLDTTHRGRIENQERGPECRGSAEVSVRSSRRKLCWN